MLKTMKSGVTYSYPLDSKSNFKCEGYRGFYTMIDVATYRNEVHVFLEHNTYGDEAPLLLVVLPLACLRWYIFEKPSGKQEKYFFIRERDILEESYDTMSIAIDDHYDNVVDIDDIEFWTDEEIDTIVED